MGFSFCFVRPKHCRDFPTRTAMRRFRFDWLLLDLLCVFYLLMTKPISQCTLATRSCLVDSEFIDRYRLVFVVGFRWSPFAICKPTCMSRRKSDLIYCYVWVFFVCFVSEAKTWCFFKRTPKKYLLLCPFYFLKPMDARGRGFSKTSMKLDEQRGCYVHPLRDKNEWLVCEPGGRSSSSSSCELSYVETNST